MTRLLGSGQIIALLFAQHDDLERRIAALEKRIIAWHRDSEVSRRLASIAGIGPMNATLICTED